MDSTMTPVQHDLLMAVLLDGREILLRHNVVRRQIDTLIKSVSRFSLDKLYSEWKLLNKSLVSGDRSYGLLSQFGLPYHWEVIRWARQTLGLFSRIEGYCDAQEAIQEWAQRCATTRSGFDRDNLTHKALQASAVCYVRRWLGVAPALVSLKPKHGPGSVSTGEKGLSKRTLTRTYVQLERQCARENPQGFLGSSAALHLNLRHLETQPYSLEVHKHPVTRVIAVPKDYYKPRIISSEPLTLQFLQQGLLRELVPRLERATTCLHFTTQETNRTLSRDMFYASLDMSNASDLISRRIVSQLFPAQWRELLFSLRSHFAELPDGTFVPLRTFAPMGSAICFPIEAICFAAIACAYLELQGLTNSEQFVHVFGDDILIPNAYAAGFIACLESIRMQPNRTKCCYNFTLFRESCGAEWYETNDITVERPRTLHDRSIGRASAEGAIPMVEHANRTAARGFLKLAQAFADLVSLPVAIGDRPGYGSPLLKWRCVGRYRWHDGYQTLLQRCATTVVDDVERLEDGDYALLFMHFVAGWSMNAQFGGRKKLTFVWRAAFVQHIPDDIKSLVHVPAARRVLVFPAGMQGGGAPSSLS